MGDKCSFVYMYPLVSLDSYLVVTISVRKSVMRGSVGGVTCPLR